MPNQAQTSKPRNRSRFRRHPARLSTSLRHDSFHLLLFSIPAQVVVYEVEPRTLQEMMADDQTYHVPAPIRLVAAE